MNKKQGVKYEYVFNRVIFEHYRKNYRTETDLYQAIDDYIEFYNTRRPHSKIQYKTPEQKEWEYAVTFGIIELE